MVNATIQNLNGKCKLHNKTLKPCENLLVERKVSKAGIEWRKVHAVLTSKMENNRECCSNRDLNSVLGMRNIVQHYIGTGERLEAYRRSTKETETKSTDPFKVKPKPIIIKRDTNHLGTLSREDPKSPSALEDPTPGMYPIMG